MTRRQVRRVDLGLFLEVYPPPFRVISSIMRRRRGVMVWVDRVMALLLLTRRGNPTGILNIGQGRSSRLDEVAALRQAQIAATTTAIAV